MPARITTVEGGIVVKAVLGSGVEVEHDQGTYLQHRKPSGSPATDLCLKGQHIDLQSSTADTSQWLATLLERPRQHTSLMLEVSSSLVSAAAF